MSGSVSCRLCGHALFATDLLDASPVQASGVSQPRCPTRCGGYPRPLLLGVSRTTMYEMIGSDEVGWSGLGRSIRVVRGPVGGVDRARGSIARRCTIDRLSWGPIAGLDLGLLPHSWVGCQTSQQPARAPRI
jgi:hypothetical protein